MMSAHSHPWPDAIDLSATLVFLAVIVLLPAAGYVFMVIDYRAHLRLLKRSLMRVGQYFAGIPEWARHETPSALSAFGLCLPCTADELKRAYRHRVKQLHPDHGGDQRRFMIAQRQFEEAMGIVAAHSLAETTAT